MIVLDTNVLSELMRSFPSETVLAWLAPHPAASSFITAASEAEIRVGVSLLPAGRRRRALEEAAEGLFTDYRGRILAFESEAAKAYAEVVVARRNSGRPIGLLDAQIASIVRTFGAVLATRNVR
ncbi:MAG: type II toxin-antitoxin system VapC family toxin, partial [Polyangiaceae bacterium]|nr:type II toxin-antitoxin system VapC family toxin [Polyangiaceae bacterium]